MAASRARPEEEDQQEEAQPQQQLVVVARSGRRPVVGLRKRERQALHLVQLQSDVLELSRQIQRLTMSRDILLSQQLTRHDDLDGSSIKAVTEYYRVFERGLILSPVDAIAFVQQVMAEDIIINNFTGRDLVIEQWKIHSVCFGDIHFRVVDMVVLPLSDTEAIVKCVSRLSAIITRLTLVLMFPHILQRPDIMNKLLGRRLVGDGRYDFVYDCVRKQFVRCKVVMDLFGVFAKLLPDPMDLTVLFQQALITDEFYIGEVEDAARQRSSPSSVYESGSSNQDEEECKASGGELPASQSSATSIEKMAMNHIVEIEDEDE